MFEHKTEAQAREEILNLVAEYCDRFHQKKPYEEGDTLPESMIIRRWSIW